MQAAASLAHRLTADVISNSGEPKGGDSGKKRKDDQQRNKEGPHDLALPKWWEWRLDGENLVVQGDKSGKDLKIVSGMKMRRSLKKDWFAFLEHVVNKAAKVNSIKDIPIVRNHPEVFLKDLHGLSPPMKVAFQVDLVLGAAPIAKVPHRLATSEIQKLSGRLQEILSKGLIRLSSSP
nr:putative reverse transcriptase domain-containing protein [Tanacetum cinerariifolium]GEZ78234.1 putative reverse transcriptase domain-containing protein [Tanacetum cinerariifolium]